MYKETMFLYLVLTSGAYGGPSDLRKIYTKLDEAIAQRRWIYEYAENGDPESIDDFDVIIMKVDSKTGETYHIDDEGQPDGSSFTPKLLGV
jgi:hypothetical protein